MPSRAEPYFWNQSQFSYQQGSDTGCCVVYDKKDTEINSVLLKSLSNKALQKCSQIIEGHVGAISQSVLHEHRVHLSILSKQVHSKVQDSHDFFNKIGMIIQEESSLVEDVAEFLAGTLQQYGDLACVADERVKATLVQAGAYLLEHYQYSQIKPLTILLVIY